MTVSRSRGKTTEIRFGIREAADVSLSVYDASGRLIRTLFDGRANPGSYVETWDGRDARGSAVGSGMYFYRLRAGERALTRKMILLK